MVFIPGMEGWFNICQSINVIYHIKSVEKIHHQFMTKENTQLNKTLNKVSAHGCFYDLIKTLHENPTAIVILNGEKLKLFSLISKKKDKDNYSFNTTRAN